MLFWKDQNKEMDFLDISLIRDTRTGSQVKIPKDLKLKNSLMIGQMDVPLEDKLVTVVYGTDMVNLNMVHFACSQKETAQEWAEELLRYSINLLALNSSALTYLDKLFTRFQLVLNNEGKVSMKNVVKNLATNRDDRKKVEKALDTMGFHAGRSEALPANKFTFDNFFSFYRHLVGRSEVDKIFDELGAKKKPYLTKEQFCDFLNKQQRDPRLNEILYPNYTLAQADALIHRFEPRSSMAQKGHLSQDGFLKFLMSEDNNIIPPDKLDMSEDMDQPLAHYFINSSHNTYLTGHQFTGKSSVEMYHQVLLSGCRCIELDCWDGKDSDQEPVITHGYTMCTEVLFKDVIEAIAQSAFKTSDYPVILSFENHCNPRQQAKMANYCRTIFGDMLLIDPLSSHPLKQDVPLPSPNQLKKKIIVKNKKKHFHRGNEEDEDTMTEDEKEKMKKKQKKALTEEEKKRRQRMKRDKGTAGKEASAAMEMSLLVNYIQPVHFHTFDASEKRKRSYEITSFVETQGTSLLKEFPVEFVNYNKRQMSRIYPRGTRVDSSNFMPQVFWNAGCQLVALNFQTLDLAMQVNLGIFEYNGRTGYILKPDFMRRPDRHFDPFAESTVDGIIAGTVSVEIISGQLLSDKKVGTYVEVDMYGLPTDTVRKKYRTKTVPNNGINPVYNEPPFIFKKVVLPNLAIVRIGVYEDQSRSLIGHRILPVEGLRPGYRHIPLRNESNQPLLTATLFVHIVVKDYVPDALAEYAKALYNPIAYQLSLVEKHTQQLEILTEDFEEEVTAEERDPSTLKLSISQSNGESNGVDGGSTTAPAGLTTSTSELSDAGTSNRRQNSVTSRGAVSMSPLPHSDSASGFQARPGGFSRGGSMSHIPVSKQESSHSANSAASSNSSAPPPMVRMQSGLLGQEGGIQTTSVLQTTKLSDTSILTPTPLAELKNHKAFLKCLAKRDKELESVKRKAERARENLEVQQQVAVDKLISSQTKTRISMDKHHSKILKKMAKEGKSTEQKQNQLKGELQELLTIQDLKHREMKASQAKALLVLGKEHFQMELDVEARHHEAMYDVLHTIMEADHASHVKMLNGIHDSEVTELMKKMDVQNREHMKMLSKKHKDKQELSRIKREVEREHVSTVVTERNKLKDILDKRQGELEVKLAEIKKDFKTDREEVLKAFKANFETNMRRLEEELAVQLDYDDLNDDNDNDDTGTPPVKTPLISVNDSRSTNGDSSPSKMVSSNSNYSNNSVASSSDKPASPGPHTTTISVTGPTKGVENGHVDGEEGSTHSSKKDAEGTPEKKVNSQEHLTTM
ncbi:hypothetical protein EGW08_018364 [Elysia chlorotica]|uniref:1-phosphatidylinositol 4,5-bisphosphate phosphodiesterase n=1 Tax=Elysia chlorotica TaxID=188477 RepID=A0A3S0Z9M1_ELYCH|nr:hypothetical protein EGW08_018364 [Elysia chlorotica]